MTVGARLEFNHFDRIARQLPQVVDKVVRKTAFEIESVAKSRAPVDTGNLKASISTMVDGPAHAVVGTNVEYAPFVEYGTRHMAAQPYLIPAAEQARPKFLDACRRLEASLG